MASSLHLCLLQCDEFSDPQVSGQRDDQVPRGVIVAPADQVISKTLVAVERALGPRQLALDLGQALGRHNGLVLRGLPLSMRATARMLYSTKHDAELEGYCVGRRST